MPSLSTLVFLVSCSYAGAVSTHVGENPIRKIVTLLQEMQKEVQAEGDKEQKAYDKFMCYCDGNGASMRKSADDGAQHADELASKLEALKAEKAQLEQELQEHQAARAAATQDANKATNIRETELADYKEQALDMQSNIEAMKGAIVALEKGGVALTQVDSTKMEVVQRLVRSNTQIDDFESQGVLDLLQGKQTEASQMMSSGQILGMLKQMQETMEKDLQDAQEAEAAAAKGFEDLSAAKESEIAAASTAIETKTKRAGEIAVEIVQTKDDFEDTSNDVKETQEFLADLAEQCAAKKASQSERVTTRAEEIAAIGETIKILNDDDALDLFKKAVPATQEGLGFLQKASRSSLALRAKVQLQALAKTGDHQAELNLVASALHGKSVDFSKITDQIDGMVGVLRSEQKDEDQQLDFCEKELTKSAQEAKDTEDALTRLAASIEEMEAASATLAAEIETLQAEIGTLDKAVTDASEQRKTDHESFVTAQAENQAAQQILEKATARMAKFYRAPDALFVQVRVASNEAAVPPPPAAAAGAYQKKTGKGNSVLSLLAEMMNDLKRDLQAATHAEESAQLDYEKLMEASKKTRASNAKSITEKESAKSEWSEKTENAKTDQMSTADSLATLKEVIAGLHSQCDFLVANYDTRKQARSNEVEGLQNAKAVLSGANFS